MPHFQRHIPANAARPTTTANQFTPPSAGSTVFMANHTARFNTTPTTAAVMAESADANFTSPRVNSMYGAPRKIQRKHGTNVVHVVINPPTMPATHGGNPPA